MELKKNEIVQLNITGMSAEGSGVGRTVSGITVFVPFTAVGDRITARIVKVRKCFAFGICEEIISASPDRILSACPYSRLCGGCVYSHISYEAELRIKRQRVADAVERIAKLSVPVNPIVFGSPERYRNKAQLPVGISPSGEITMGFYSRHSHRIADGVDCLLQPECFGTAAQVVREFLTANRITVYDESTGKGLVRHLYLRCGAGTDELMVCLVINGKTLPQEALLVSSLREALPNLKSVIVNSNTENTNVILGKHCRTIYGSDCITDELCGLRFLISPRSFYQVNREMAQRLYTIAADCAGLSGGEVLLDLYCGTGTIGLTMAHRCKEVIGVELIPEAVSDAVKNAGNNGIENARFICADAAAAAEQLRQEGLHPDVVIIDPPRKGCTGQLIDTIAAMSPERVVYVSCDPGTLARDLRLFADSGYITQSITPVDMFPRTAHVESVARLVRA